MSQNAIAKIDFDQEQLAVIEAQFFPAGASKAEMQYCFSVAKTLALNPILKEVQFVPRRARIGDKWVNKVEPMVGRDGFLSIGHRTNQLAGIETTATIRDIPQLENGKWVVKPQLVAECVVWRKDSSKPFTTQVSYNEYCQKTADGNPTKFWAEKPETMLKKVAESQALRKAFNIHGVYCPEELGAGFETETGDIVTPAIEAEFTSSHPEKSHLSVVTPTKRTVSAERQVIHPSQDTPPPPDDEDTWPDPPEPPQQNTSLPEDGMVSEIISILEGRNIPYDIDMQNGIISAKSYNERQILKDSGFRWNGDTKSWVFKFEPEPF